MALRKLQVLFAIPEPLTTDQQKVWDVTIASLKKLKPFAIKINAGKENEEPTNKASWHICHHDETPPTCEPEVEI